MLEILFIVYILLGVYLFISIEIGMNESIGYGSVPSKYMEEINGACRKGITIWHDHSNLGDFSLNNTIV